MSWSFEASMARAALSRCELERSRARSFARLWKEAARRATNSCTLLIRMSEQHHETVRLTLYQMAVESKHYEAIAARYRTALETIAGSPYDGAWCRVVAGRALGDAGARWQ